jgi:hypothetical protein
LFRVVINEFLANTDDAALDFVELYNPGDTDVVLDGCGLSDSPDTNVYIFPGGTILPAGGYLWRDQNQLGFALAAKGETIYLRDAAGTRVIDAVRFGGQARGVTTGRWPDGADALHPLAAPTPGLPNAGWREANLVISEIMYHPVSGEDDDQYVEIHNRGGDAVDLGGWELAGGIRYRFPIPTMIGGGGYLVVARQAARLRNRYAQLDDGNCLGDFDGRLSGRGERVVLTRREESGAADETGLIEAEEIQCVED